MLTRSGANLGENDTWIASCARAAGAVVLTLDEDFTRIDPAMVDYVYVPQKEL